MQLECYDGVCPYPQTAAPEVAMAIPVNPTTQFCCSSQSSRSHTSAIFVEFHKASHWSTGLCDCFGDPPLFARTFFCPCLTFGEIADIVGEGSVSCEVSGTVYALLCWLSACCSLYSCFYRAKLRSQYSLRERPCSDCLVHCFCGPCALAQEHRELQEQGFDMSMDYKENMERKRNRVIFMPPGVVRGMQ